MTGTASEMLGQIRTLRAKAEGQLEAVQRTRIALRDCQPRYEEEAARYEARRARAEAAARREEAVADDLAIDLRQGMAPIQRALEGERGYGLSADEWTKAGQLSGLAENLIGGDTPLDQAAAELRTAIQSGDRPRVVAFASAAEARLRRGAAEGGKASLSQKQDREEIRRLISEARRLARDTSLDPVREAYAGLVGASGDLSSAVFRARAARKPVTASNGNEKVPWLVRSSDGSSWEPRRNPYRG